VALPNAPPPLKRDPSEVPVPPRPAKFDLVEANPRELEAKLRVLEPLKPREADPPAKDRDEPTALPPALRLPPNECHAPSARAEFVAPPRDPPKL
jgi:hypothetical protein